MSILETSAIAVAISAGIMAAASVVGLVSLWRIRRRVDAMSLHAHRTLVQLGGVAGELEAVVRRAMRLEKRVHRAADLILNEIEPLLLVMSAGVAAARAGLTSWMGSRADGARAEDCSRSETVPQKGEEHEQGTKR